MSTVTTTNLIQGPGTLYWGAFGATEPATTLSALQGAPASGTWTDVGATDGGVKLNVGLTYTEVTVDQLVDTPERRLTKREATVSTSLAEATLANLAFALNSAAPSAGSGTLTLDAPGDTPATVPNYSALIFDGFAPSNKKRRVIARKCLNTGGVGTSYEHASKTMFPVTFTTHYVSASIKPYSILDES